MKSYQKLVLYKHVCILNTDIKYPSAVGDTKPYNMCPSASITTDFQSTEQLEPDHYIYVGFTNNFMQTFHTFINLI